MTEILGIFSNREVATITWIFLVILGLQFNERTRKTIGGLFEAFFVNSILVVNLLAIIYSSSIIYLLYLVDFWGFFMLKDSIYWFICSGFLILISLNKAAKEKDFFKNILRDNLKLLLILEFAVNFHQFSLVTELILLPVIAFLTFTQVIATREKRLMIVKPRFKL